MIAIVTGATGDIGQFVTEALIHDGFFVVGVGRDLIKGDSFAKRFSKQTFKFLNIDVSDNLAVEGFFAEPEIRTSTLGCLVTCAGILEMRNITEIKYSEWERSINTNLTGTFNFFHHSIKKIKEDKNSATLYAIGSRWGSSGHKNACAYSATKSALKSFIKALQYDLIDSSIRAMLISPGSVAGKMAMSVDEKNASIYIDPQQIGHLISFINKTPENILFDEISIKAFPYDYQN